MFRHSLPMVVVAVAAFAGGGQSQPAGPGKKAGPYDNVPGYQKRVVEGFTVLLSDEARTADAGKFERKPAEVLELELKLVTKLMTPKAVEVLRRLPIFVEWDEKVVMSNGRTGGAVAVYYGGHQASLVGIGVNPLKAKTVTVLSLRSLTAEHQPKTDSGRCVLLHEMAHAVHDQLVGRDSPAVQTAYRTAMERKLYDKSLYAATNDAEYFAELTCAYFDQLNYFPRNRDELRKHDPAGFKVMQSVWGRSAVARATPAAGSALANTGSDKFDLGVKLSDVRFAEPSAGPALSDEELAGKVLVVGSWGRQDAAVLAKLLQLADELGPYGLRLVLVSNPGYGADPARAKADIADRGPWTSVVSQAGLPEPGDDRLIIPRPPHTLVFDPDGTCVFRGTGYDALPHARAAVGRRLVAALNKDDLPKPLAGGAAALTGGQPLLAALPKIAPLASDPEAAADAKKLTALLLRPSEKLLEEAQGLAKSDPAAAYLTAEKVVFGYKGTPAAAKASTLATGLRSDKAVSAELAARKALEPIQKLDGQLTALPGGINPSDPRFQAANARAVTQLRTAVEQMRKKYPNARATADAERIARQYNPQ